MASNRRCLIVLFALLVLLCAVQGQEVDNDVNEYPEIYKETQNNDDSGSDNEREDRIMLLAKLLRRVENDKDFPSNEVKGHAVVTKQLHVPGILRRFSMPSVIKKHGMFSPSIIKRTEPEADDEVQQPASRSGYMWIPSILKRYSMMPTIIKRNRFMSPSIIKRDTDGQDELADDNSY